MFYVEERLDRRTGDLLQSSIGEWITVTELGEQHGVGRKTVRAILHHMGVLQREGRSYRLAFSFVKRGLGKRIDHSQSGYPFDVLSPALQTMIAKAWDDVTADYEACRVAEAGVCGARNRLAAFEARRSRPMQTQEQVCWLLDHLPSLTMEAVAAIVEIDRGLVSRYAGVRRRNRAFRERRKKAPLASFEPTASDAEHMMPADEAERSACSPL